jgi:hypothetical protein
MECLISCEPILFFLAHSQKLFVVLKIAVVRYICMLEK